MSSCVVGAGAVAHLARLDDDPSLSARPLQRTVERAFLAEAARRGPGDYTVTVGDSGLVWT